ncbi:MAG: hypothetical protein HDS28_01620 [Bacteroides sp.]|nr:hypothetical protein [Bacteroides sp.]
MKTIKYLCISATVFALTSCGGDKKTDDSSSDETVSESYMPDSVSTVADTVAVTEVAEVVEAEAPVEEKKTSSSENWDKILDEYESYCNKLASLSKKVMGGDMSAMTEYASLVEQAESLGNKLENAENEMTTAQIARMNKIAAKLASSMM